MRNPDMILGSVITEKSMIAKENGVYTFKVDKKATKTQIKYEIEKHFDVKVSKINTLVTKPKDRRVGKYTGKTKTFKKAMVTLADGYSIDL